MDCTNLYRTLVLGGAVLAGACATSSKQVASPEIPVPSTSENPGSEPGPDSNAEQKGAVTVPLNQGGELACDDICSGGEGRERFCPDLVTGGDNCCWLMVDPHPCCD